MEQPQVLRQGMQEATEAEKGKERGWPLEPLSREQSGQQPQVSLLASSIVREGRCCHLSWQPQETNTYSYLSGLFHPAKLFLESFMRW